VKRVGFTNLIAPPACIREPHHRDDRDAGHEPGPTPSPAPLAVVSGGAACGPAELSPRPSSPGEFHPEALTEPCLTVSGHTARAIHGELPPPGHGRSVPPVTGLRARRPLRLTKSFTTRMARPLRSTGITRFMATTEQSAPARCFGTFGLAGHPLAPFPLAPPSRFSSSAPEPKPESRLLYPANIQSGSLAPAGRTAYCRWDKDFHGRRCSSVAPSQGVDVVRPDSAICRGIRPVSRVLKSSRLSRRSPVPGGKVGRFHSRSSRIPSPTPVISASRSSQRSDPRDNPRTRGQA
jgi:hypothetical protein